MKGSTQDVIDIVKAKGLSKMFGSFLAVDNIDFSVEKQECLGLLGPNGAGKTTTIRMVSCFFEPSYGVLEVFGRKAEEGQRFIKSQIGICPQENNLDPDLTVENNLLVFARYFDIVKKEAEISSEKLLHFVGLFSKRKSQIEDLSSGMKRRLLIARSLLNKPRLLILDEPSIGLDPQSRHQIWDSLHQLKREGMTILITTHYMDEAAHLCDRIMVMDQGKIIAQGAPRDLIKQYIGLSVIEIVSISSINEEVERYLKEKSVTYEKTSTHFFIYGQDLMFLWQEISQKFGEDFCLLRMANLEDVFLKLTGRVLRDA